MKKVLQTITVCTAAVCFLMFGTGESAYAAPKKVAINEKNFSWFMEREAKDLDKDRDGYLSESEAAKMTSLYVSGMKKDIDSLKGIEYFTSLRTIEIDAGIPSYSEDPLADGHVQSTLSELDLSKCKKLEKVTVENAYFLEKVNLKEILKQSKC